MTLLASSGKLLHSLKKRWFFQISYLLFRNGNNLFQIEDAAVEKLVDFLNINKMRENSMVTTFLHCCLPSLLYLCGEIQFAKQRLSSWQLISQLTPPRTFSPTWVRFHPVLWRKKHSLATICEGFLYIYKELRLALGSGEQISGETSHRGETQLHQVLPKFLVFHL